MLGLLHFQAESFNYFIHVVVFHFQIAFGLRYAVLEQLKFGIEGLANIEYVIAALICFLADLLHLLFESVEFMFYAVFLLSYFGGFAFEDGEVDFGTVFLDEGLEHLVAVGFLLV